MFTMITNSNKLSNLEAKKTELSEELKAASSTLEKLRSKGEIERFAREKKFFKMDDEDVFVIYNNTEED